MNDKIKAARRAVNLLKFGTPEWEAAMQAVRDLVKAESAAIPDEEYCSVDSGEHRTRLLNGNIIG